jgi:hypothetical protein
MWEDEYSRIRQRAEEAMWRKNALDMAAKYSPPNADEKAVVFVITDGKAMCIEDDLNLFPSDTLITQLRLLQETN